MSYPERVDDYLETEHPELPWSQMRGIHNKVVHECFDVAWDVVWDTVKQDVPPLLDQIRALLHATNAQAPKR